MSLFNRDKETQSPTKKMIRRTMLLMAVCGFAAFIVLFLKLYNITVTKHEEYKSAASKQQGVIKKVSPYRGIIYGSEGEILAVSTEAYNIFLSPAEIKLYKEDAVKLTTEVSEILNLDKEYLLKLCEKTDSWYEIIARKTDKETAEKIMELIKTNKYKGIKWERELKRQYPFENLASQVIGFTDFDGNGVIGVESAYNDLLAGRIDSSLKINNIELSAKGTGKTSNSSGGNNVYLTINTKIQNIMEKQLKAAVEKYSAEGGGTAICMEVDTGAILGMVSLGDFDLNNYASLSDSAESEINRATASEDEKKALILQAQQRQWKNLAISYEYEPGSVFKIITLAMALDSGKTSEEMTYNCTGSLLVTGDENPRNCWNKFGHGDMNLRRAVCQSCNVAFMQIGLDVGAKSFYDYAEAFGFLARSNDMNRSLTAKTGIDVAGESGSLWWSENTFCNPDNLSQLAAASFGQTFLVTPIQLVTAVSAACNGGRLMQPFVVNKVESIEGNLIYRHYPQVVRKVISENASKEVCRLLEAVVSDMKEGSGKNAYVAGYRIGGKTGTSVNTLLEVTKEEKSYAVSFLGVAPIDNPKIAVLVLLDKPKETEGVFTSGGEMAAPVVGSILEEILPEIGVKKKLSDTDFANMDKQVPDLTGLSAEKAKETAINSGLNARIKGEGTVINMQLPSAGAVIAAGSEIILYADATPSEEMEEMPDLRNLSYEIAAVRMSNLGLFISSDSFVHSISAQKVIAQSAQPGTMLEHGTVVTITLSDGSKRNVGIY